MSFLERKTKWTIGDVEATPGAGGAMVHVVPIVGLVPPMKKAIREPDPVVNGSDFEVGDYLVADDVGAPIAISPRACPGFGKLVNSNLSGQSAAVQVGACIRVRYTGASASCKIVSDTAANTLAAKTGTLGAEADNATWGGGAPIDLTAAPTDTVGELVAVIDAYADFECEKVFGADAVSAGLIVNKITQAKSKWAYLWFTSVATSAYERHFDPDLTSAERPTYPMQGDGFGDNYLYKGMQVDVLSIEAERKGMVKGTATVQGFSETAGQVASLLTLEDVGPMFFWSGAFDFGGRTFPQVERIAAKFDNRGEKEGYGQGSSGRIYHEKGMPQITGELSLRLDAYTFAHRAELFSTTNARFALSFYFKGGEVSTGVPELFLVEIPYGQPTDFEYSSRNGIQRVRIPWKAIYPKDAAYDSAALVTMVTAQSAAY